MVVKGVTENKAGTMSGGKGQAEAPPSEDKTPGDASKVSPEDTPKYSQKAYEAAVHAAKSEAGRTVKALEAREQAVRDVEAKEAERQKARDLKEREAVKGDPDKLSIVEERQNLRNEKAEVARQKAENEATAAKNLVAIEAANATKLETAIFEIAKKHEVDPATLKKLNITDLKQLEGIAKAISEKKPFVDSGKNKGGGSFDSLSAKGKVSESLRRMRK
ncbi:hypothetical protein LCGC14_1607570 [marine sediment metagenome]|uniref:Uncharacterized protein n=1 Tax=marine sediment metagenome TaxID=412755 RepID=A0A0F9L9C4_9ZZZZ